jgi:hypothetical protein
MRCSFSSARRSWSARPLALSSSDYYKITRLSAMLQKQNNQASDNTSQETHNECMVDGDDAGLQSPHVLIVLKPIILPRGVIPIN